MREGSGRPPLGATKLSVTLLAAQIAKVERWQEANGLDSFSEAVRQMIDAVPAL